MPPLIRPQKKQPSIAKIAFGIVAIFALAYGGYRGVTWIFAGGGVEALQTVAPSTLDTARALLEEGKSNEAREALRPIAAGAKDPQVAVPAIMLLADLDTRAGDRAHAIEGLKRITTEFSDSPERPRAMALYVTARGRR